MAPSSKSRTKPVVIVAFPVDPLVTERLSEYYIVHYVPDRNQREERSPVPRSTCSKASPACRQS
jgi:hypothetical protein